MLRLTYIACLVNLGLKKLNTETTAEPNDMTKQAWIGFHCYWNTELILDACRCAGLNFLAHETHIAEN